MSSIEQPQRVGETAAALIEGLDTLAGRLERYKALVAELIEANEDVVHLWVISGGSERSPMVEAAKETVAKAKALLTA